MGGGSGSGASMGPSPKGGQMGGYGAPQPRPMPMGPSPKGGQMGGYGGQMGAQMRGPGGYPGQMGPSPKGGQMGGNADMARINAARQAEMLASAGQMGGMGGQADQFRPGMSREEFQNDFFARGNNITGDMGAMDREYEAYKAGTGRYGGGGADPRMSTALASRNEMMANAQSDAQRAQIMGAFQNRFGGGDGQLMTLGSFDRGNAPVSRRLDDGPMGGQPVSRAQLDRVNAFARRNANLGRIDDANQTEAQARAQQQADQFARFKASQGNNFAQMPRTGYAGAQPVRGMPMQPPMRGQMGASPKGGMRNMTTPQRIPPALMGGLGAMLSRNRFQ